MEKKPKRTLKDSVFLALFRILSNAIKLYKRFHPEDNTVTEGDCKILTLQTVLVNGIHNDFALQVRDKLMIFMEAQSTYNTSIPMRIALYYFETMLRYIENNNISIYDDYKIPVPEFYMVYVGPKRKLPNMIYLSDMFEEDVDTKHPNLHGFINLGVKVVRKSGKGDILDQYVRFCEISYEMREKYGDTRKAIEATIDKCLREGILVEFLNSRREEVMDIMTTLYDEEVINRHYERHIRRKIRQEVQQEVRQEVQQEVRQEESEKGIRALIKTLHDLSLPQDAAIQAVVKNFSLSPETAVEKVSLYWQ